MKCLGVTLTKQVRELYKKNIKTPKKEIKEDNRRWKRSSYSWNSRINIVKMAILPKTMYRYNKIHTKILTQLLQTSK